MLDSGDVRTDITYREQKPIQGKGIIRQYALLCGASVKLVFLPQRGRIKMLFMW
jgi:hypothetical protein